MNEIVESLSEQLLKAKRNVEHSRWSPYNFRNARKKVVKLERELEKVLND